MRGFRNRHRNDLEADGRRRTIRHPRYRRAPGSSAPLRAGFAARVADLPVMAATGLQYLFEREHVLIAEVALQRRTPTPPAGASGAKAPCP